MDLLLFAIPVALIAAVAAVAAFVWAARSGQFDDLETPAHRMLVDDEPARTEGPRHQEPASHHPPLPPRPGR